MYKTTQEQREYARQWYQNNKERCKANNKAWKAANKERYAEITKAWYEKPENVDYRKKQRSSLEARFKSGQTQARQRHFAFNMTFEEYCEVIKEGKCHYCGQELNESGSGLDRKNNEPFYTVENVVPCCGRCNRVFVNLFTYPEKLIVADALKIVDDGRVMQV